MSAASDLRSLPGQRRWNSDLADDVSVGENASCGRSPVDEYFEFSALPQFLLDIN